MKNDCYKCADETQMAQKRLLEYDLEDALERVRYYSSLIVLSKDRRFSAYRGPQVNEELYNTWVLCYKMACNDFLAAQAQLENLTSVVIKTKVEDIPSAPTKNPLFSRSIENAAREEESRRKKLAYEQERKERIKRFKSEYEYETYCKYSSTMPSCSMNDIYDAYNEYREYESMEW